jgi:hypothetical protein
MFVVNCHEVTGGTKKKNGHLMLLLCAANLILLLCAANLILLLCAANLILLLCAANGDGWRLA